MYKVQFNAQVGWVGKLQVLDRLCYETEWLASQEYSSTIPGTIQWDNLVWGDGLSRGGNC